MKKKRLSKIRLPLFILISFLFGIILGTSLIVYTQGHKEKSNQDTEKEDKRQSSTNSNGEASELERESESGLSQEQASRKVEIDTITITLDIEDILAEELSDYGVYIKGLDSDIEVAINGDVLFFPGSIYKVPIAILVLRDIEQAKYSLDSTILLKEENKKYDYDATAQSATGTYHRIDKLLSYMIRYSDNTAWDMLQDNMGTTEQLDKRFEEELELTHTRKTPFQSTASEIGEILEGIYTYKYLNESNSEYLLDIMSQIIESQNDRIPAGVPEGTRVAHKIGNWYGIWEDGGIVYGSKENYIIVVLNRNTTVSSACFKISEISRITWEYFNGT